MALFEITPDIQKLADPITPGWYPLEITKIEDKVEGKDFPMTVFSIKVLDGPNKDRLIWNNVNHDPQYMHFSLEWLRFQLGNRKLDKTKTEKVNMTVDNVAHKQFMGYIDNKKDKEGRIMNTLTKFRPMAERAKLLASDAAKKAPVTA